MNPHPYAELTPGVILDAIESLGIELDGRLQSLNSYENRVYKLGCEDGSSVVAKFYRPQRLSDAAIEQEHAFSLALQQQELPVVAPTVFSGQSLHWHAGFRFAVFPNQGGHAPEFESAEHLSWMGRVLARIHNVGASMNLDQRAQLDVDALGEIPFAWLLENKAMPDHLLERYDQVGSDLLDSIDRAIEQAGEGIHMIAIHGDCHPGNILWTDAGPHFVDLDDCVRGPAVQDLWMMLSGDRAAREAQFEAIAEGYEQFRPFDRRELKLIESLRSLRMMHYAYWLARRWEDPAFPQNFPWFGTERYWDEHIASLAEQAERIEQDL